jgi:hypothetical protein
VKHRGVEYSVEEDRPGFWRWIIYQKMEDGQKVTGEAKYSLPPTYCQKNTRLPIPSLG